MEGMEEDGSSHLQRCFQRADDWPSQGLSQAEDLADLQNHEREFCAGGLERNRQAMGVTHTSTLDAFVTLE